MATISASPVSVAKGTSSATLNLIGIGTAWTSATTFTASAGTVVSKTYISATSYTLVYTAPSTAQSVNISDGTNTFQLPINPTVDIAISPAFVPVSTSGNTLNLTGTGTSWVSGTTVFTATGGTISSTVINSPTSATLTYTSPAKQGRIVISDGTNGGSFVISPTGLGVVASDNFLRADAAAGGVGNGWIDNSSIFKIGGNQLQTVTGTASFNNRLLRPTTEAFANGSARIHFGPNITAGASSIGIVGRVGEVTDNAGSCVGAITTPNSVNAGSGLFLFYEPAGGARVFLGTILSNLTVPAEGWLELLLSGNTATANLYQADGVTLIGTTTYTGSILTGVYAAAGSWGIVNYTGASGMYFSEFDTFAGVSISTNSSTLGLNSSTTLSVSGFGTSFSGSPFTISGVAGCSITSQSLSSATAASLTIATGNTAGTLTLTDTGSGATTTISVAAMSVPSITQTPVEIVTGNPVIVFSGAASNGVAPYTYRLYRSPNAFLNTISYPPVLANDPSAALINTQTPSGTTAPSNFTDTSPLHGANYYVLSVTDSNGQTVWAPYQAVAMVPAPSNIPGFMMIGDSKGAGHTSASFLQYVGSIDMTAGGSGYSANPVITPSYGNATFAANVVGGVIKYIYPTNQQQAPGYTNELALPTLTITDSTGTGAAAAVHSLTGGPLLAAKHILEEKYGYPSIKILNCSAGGTTTYNWLPYGTNNGTNQANSSDYFLEAAKAAAGSAAAYPIWVIFHGANDAGHSLTKAQFKANYLAIIQNLMAWGVQKIICVCPTWWGLQGANGSGTIAMLQQYTAALLELAAAYPGVIFAPGANNLKVTNARQELLYSDLLHDSDAGIGVLGAQIADTLSGIIGVSLTSPYSHS